MYKKGTSGKNIKFHGKNIFLKLKDTKRVLKVTKKGLKMTDMIKPMRSKDNKWGAQNIKGA